MCTISAPAGVARCSVCPFPERLTAAGFLLTWRKSYARCTSQQLFVTTDGFCPSPRSRRLATPWGQINLNEGFFGTAAPRYTDLVLLLEIALGLALLAGAVLARRKRFRLHACCQSAVVLLHFAILPHPSQIDVDIAFLSLRASVF